VRGRCEVEGEERREKGKEKKNVPKKKVDQIGDVNMMRDGRRVEEGRGGGGKGGGGCRD
jgi:hypothetical protein